MVKDSMSEIISNTRFFLHRTPTESVNYSGESAPEPEQQKNRKWLKRSILAGVGYLAFVSVDNAKFYYDTTRVSADDNRMLYDIDGCDPFPDNEAGKDTDTGDSSNTLTATEKQAIENIEFEFKDTKSAARNFEPHKFNPAKFVLDWVEIHKNEQLAFTSEISGLNVYLYSDTKNYPFQIEDKQETITTLDELIHSSLDTRVNYEHLGVAAYIDCLRHRYINPEGPRELEDKRLNVYVPSRPGVCFSNGLVQDFPDGAIYREFCDSIGATKDIRLAVRPFYEYRQNWMVLMTNDKTPTAAEHELSELFVHEPTHFLMETAGMPFRYDENEALADYLEQQVLDQLYSEHLPVSLSYPEEAYSGFKLQD
jgi:hypothetical protein